MIAKGSSLLTKYNDSGNATFGFFNVTDDLSFGKIVFLILLLDRVVGSVFHFRMLYQFVITAKSREPG